MSNIVKELRKARPTLKEVSPLSHYIVFIMAVFNILLGISLYISFDANRVSSSLIIVNDIFSYRFWGMVFIGIGVLKLYSLKTNNWALSRHTLLLGVSIKAMWAVALTIRVFVSPGTLLVNLIWVALAAIQMACYIWFMPPSTTVKEQRRIDR